MKLIMIYGPPAAGKFTVAKEISKITGYKLLHNHLTVDLLNSVFKFGAGNFFDLSSKIRLDIFEEAAKQRLDLIFTFCYSHPEDDKWVKLVLKRMRKYHAQVLFVRLTCKESELKKRVKHASREDFDKIKTIKSLKRSLERWNFRIPIPFVKSLQIDNTNVSPKKAARIIKGEYKL